MHINTFTKATDEQKKNGFPLNVFGLALLLLPKLLFLCWFDTLCRKPNKTNIIARVPIAKIDRHVQIDVPETQSLPTHQHYRNPSPAPQETLHYLSLLSAMVAMLLS